jgi:hypothetical protein
VTPTLDWLRRMLAAAANCALIGTIESSETMTIAALAG